MKPGPRLEILLHCPLADHPILAGGQVVPAVAANTVFLYCYLYTVVLYSLNPD